MEFGDFVKLKWNLEPLVVGLLFVSAWCGVVLLVVVFGVCRLIQVKTNGA